MSRRRTIGVAAGATAAGVGSWLALRKRRVSAYPPGPDAISPDEAKAVGEELAALPRVGRADRVLDFAPALSAILVGGFSLDAEIA